MTFQGVQSIGAGAARIYNVEVYLCPKCGCNGRYEKGAENNRNQMTASRWMTWCIASTAGNSIDPRGIKQGSVGADHQYLVYRFGYRYSRAAASSSF
jgi:hypothetical protein